MPVELSLTGGKDSRLIAAALTAAKVPFRARTHGFASHPDVIVAAMIARQLGVEHVVTEPRAAAPEQAPDEAELLARLRSAVLVCDGMLSAFENLGRPDPQPATEPVQTGGHGGELLRGGYAPAAWSERRPARAWSEARGAELFRRMLTRRLGLLRPAAAGRVPGQPDPVRGRAAPRAAARPRRVLPGEPGRPVVGRGPAGLPDPVAAGPAPVRRPGRAGRTRRSRCGTGSPTGCTAASWPS